MKFKVIEVTGYAVVPEGAPSRSYATVDIADAVCAALNEHEDRRMAEFRARAGGLLSGSQAKAFGRDAARIAEPERYQLPEDETETAKANGALPD